jgi:hypothetical protein
VRGRELFDTAHAVLPSTLSLGKFYREYGGLWRHAMEVWLRHRGWWMTHGGLAATLLTGPQLEDSTATAPVAQAT